MSDSHAEEIKKHVKTYIVVFGALAVLTIVTVAVSYLDINVTAAITVALVIAATKASLVAAFFMHLISEQKLVYWVLILTGVFFIVLIILFVSAYHDQLGIFG
ncbi:MAG: cytochrome C oxidase subunit IV family protein [bacterium]